MKAINRILKNKKLSDDEKVNKVVTAGLLTSATAQALLKPDFCGRIGFAGYQLTNNNANINRMKKRLESLENMPTESKTTNHDGFDVVENAEINRIQIVFPGKPDTETRSILKQNGFRWSRYEMAWQRHLNNSGRYAVSNVLSGIRGLNY